MSTCTILVAYHKTAFNVLENLQDVDPEGKIYLPIYGGHALGDIPEEYKDMIGDDTGDNISVLNPYINEPTIMYWAWKNYDKIGNPDYIGLNHYRRLMHYSILKDKLAPDVICVCPEVYDITIRRKLQSKKLFNFEDELRYIIDDDITNPKEKEAIDKWYRHRLLYARNLFIMHKDKFNIYMNYMQRALDKIKELKIVEQSDNPDSKYHRRSASYMLEIITSSIFTRMSISDGCKLEYTFYDYTE